MALALAPIVADVVTTDIFIVGVGATISEDVYVAAQSGTVEGTIDGDLVIVGGDLTISGTVTGSVNALSSGTIRVTETGRIDGALRAAARQVVVAGDVGEDLAATAVSTRIESGGGVGRDVVAFAAALTIDGGVGRDVRGRVFDVSISGDVGNDVDITVSRLTVGDEATIGGDVLYRSAGEAAIAEGATITGQIVRLPSSPNFLYGIILTLANIVSLLAFVVIGCVAIWLFRGSSARAVDAALRRPMRSLLTGLVAVVLTPVLIVVFAVTLVGLPLALALVVLMIVGLVLGPAPFVTAVGDRILRSKGGLFGAFVLGALLWRLGIWFIPWIGGFLFLVGLVWGVGAWIVGGWSQRNMSGEDIDLLPPAMRLEDELPDDWDFPLPPMPGLPTTPVAADVAEGDESEAEHVAPEPPAVPQEDDLASRIAAITGFADARPADGAAAGEEREDDEPAPDEPQDDEPAPAEPQDGDDWGLPSH